MPCVFVYIIVHDIGFAPNPYHGVCTLATCKPRIRGKAKIGDWVAGIGSAQKNQKGHLVFTMRVDETLSYDEYWNESRFERKKPNRVGSLKQRYGDNIYHRAPDGNSWIQEDSRHSFDDGMSNMKHVVRDTQYPRVLISETFAYYGNQAIKIPAKFRNWKGEDICQCGRDYKYKYQDDLRENFIKWLNSKITEGIAGEPLDWSWHGS